MKKLFVGPCPLCNKQIYKQERIIVDGRECFKTILNDEGTTFWVKSNYNSKMQISICNQCLKTLDKPRVAQIVDDCVFTWLLELIEDKEMSEEKKRYRFDEIRFFVATDFANTEEDLSKKVSA